AGRGSGGLRDALLRQGAVLAVVVVRGGRGLVVPRLVAQGGQERLDVPPPLVGGDGRAHRRLPGGVPGTSGRGGRQRGGSGPGDGTCGRTRTALAHRGLPGRCVGGTLRMVAGHTGRWVGRSARRLGRGRMGGSRGAVPGRSWGTSPFVACVGAPGRI